MENISYTEYIFVYGTLRKGIDIPINNAIAGDLEWIGTGAIKGGLYDIGNYPGVIKEDLGKIKGDVFKLVNSKKTLKILDDYERFDVDNLEESDYIREAVEVNFENKKIQAWIYWYNQPVEGKVWIEKGDYLAYLKEKKTA